MELTKHGLIHEDDDERNLSFNEVFGIETYSVL
jgi:hypothetical protein